MALDAWLNFITAQAGVSAALLGLLFIGISLNLTKIVSIRSLTDRALTAMVLLFAILFLSSLLLIPGQSIFARGLAVFAVGLLTWAGGTMLVLSSRKDQSRRHFALHVLLLEIATLPYLVSGALLMGGQPGGMYWFAAAVLGSLFKALVEAWVLLIEINR